MPGLPWQILWLVAPDETAGFINEKDWIFVAVESGFDGAVEEVGGFEGEAKARVVPTGSRAVADWWETSSFWAR
jgi:hypothetical protein